MKYKIFTVTALTGGVVAELFGGCIFRPQNSICTDFQTQSHGE